MLRKTLIALMAIAALGMGSTAIAMHSGGAVLVAVVDGTGAVAALPAVAGGTAAAGTRAPSTVIPSHVTPSSYITAISLRTATSRSSDTVISSVLVSMPPLLAGLGCLRVTAGTESGYAAGHITEAARRRPAEHIARRAEEQKKGAEDAPDMCVDHNCDAIDLLRR